MNDLKYILVKGNLSDGFTFIGPFDSFDEAAFCQDAVRGYSWVASLHEPEKA